MPFAIMELRQVDKGSKNGDDEENYKLFLSVCAFQMLFPAAFSSIATFYSFYFSARLDLYCDTHSHDS